METPIDHQGTEGRQANAPGTSITGLETRDLGVCGYDVTVTWLVTREGDVYPTGCSHLECRSLMFGTRVPRRKCRSG